VIEHRQCDTLFRQGVNLSNFGLFVNAATHRLPNRLTELRQANGGDRSRRRELQQQSDEPFVALGRPKSLDLRKVQSQVMGELDVLQSRPCTRDVKVCLRELLQVVGLHDNWIAVPLRHSLL